MWYRQVKCHTPTLNKEGLEHTSTMREDLYRKRPPEGEATPILVQPAEIPDGPPEGEEIAVSV